jgi:hypothetical protein
MMFGGGIFIFRQADALTNIASNIYLYLFMILF